MHIKLKRKDENLIIEIDLKEDEIVRRVLAIQKIVCRKTRNG